MRERLGARLSGCWVALLAALLDRGSKAWALASPQRRALIPDVLNFRLAENSGAAFSMLSGQGLGLIVLTAVIILAVTAWLVARPEAPAGLRTGLWMIVGGGLGNLYDRVTTGGVTDFLEPAFVRFAVFNVADVCICLGAALVVVAVLLDGRKSGTR